MHAVVQLRQDNKQGSIWNMVGFQTKMKHSAQVELFRTIPGLEKAEFARLGGLHRNTFIRSPILLDRQLRLKSAPNVRFAGQITGCEGYVESSAVGLMAGIMTAAELAGRDITQPPPTTAFGALLGHITGDAHADDYQPMNVNFGLFAPFEDKVHKKSRKAAITSRARTDLGCVDFDAIRLAALTTTSGLFAPVLAGSLANSLRVSNLSRFPSAPAKRSPVAAAHSSNVSKLLPSLSSDLNALVRLPIISNRETNSSRFRS